MSENREKTPLGIPANIEAVLCYVLGLVTGIVFLLIEKKDEFVRFHAMQSLITFGSIFILQTVVSAMGFLVFLLPLISLASVALWIILMIKAYQGEKFMLPKIGEIADRNKNAFGAGGNSTDVK